MDQVLQLADGGLVKAAAEITGGRWVREPLGAQGVAFRPEELSVRQINGAWAICDPARPLLAFGDHAEEAKETLKAIQHHGFDTFCQLGQGERPMTILAKTR